MTEEQLGLWSPSDDTGANPEAAEPQGFWGSGGHIKSRKKLNARHEFDFYPTPYELCAAALQAIADLTPNIPTILDPGAGTGVWGDAARALYPSAYITGVELRTDAPLPATYNRFHYADFLHNETVQGDLFDMAIGNPPYGIKKKGQAYIPLAEPFVRKSLSHLWNGGILAFLLRSAFLETVGRGRGLFREFPPIRVYQCMQRPSFYPPGSESAGATDATSYSVIVWKKGYTGETALRWLDWQKD